MLVFGGLCVPEPVQRTSSSPAARGQSTRAHCCEACSSHEQRDCLGSLNYYPPAPAPLPSARDPTPRPREDCVAGLAVIDLRTRTVVEYNLVVRCLQCNATCTSTH